MSRSKIFLLYIIFSLPHNFQFIVGRTIDVNSKDCTFLSFFVPISYAIQLATSIENKTFDGVIQIKGSTEMNTKIITLHSGVNILDITVKDSTSKELVYLKSYFQNYSSDTLEIIFVKELKANTDYEIFIEFSGEMRNKNGIFTTSYKHEDGSESLIVATSFQASYARYAFPCVDDPSKKANFTLKLARPATSIALSNTPLLETSEADPDINYQVWDSFEPTPPMSTYNLAFIICDYVGIETLKNNTIWVPKQLKSQALLASNLVPLYVEAMENYTDIPFPLKKLDHILVPNMESSAMENWGLIAYRSDLLLFNENTSSTRDEQIYISYMAHEIVHQWFGNLVTCKSWAYTWLNEGLTTFVQIYISDKVFPQWKMFDLFMTNEVHEIMYSESFEPNVLTTLQDCFNQDVLHNVFTLSSYYKGAAVMRMLQAALTADVLNEGLKLYLKNNSYKSVGDYELWKSLQEATGSEVIDLANVTIFEIMQSWTKNYGYPVLNVRRDSSNKIYLEQEMFQVFGTYLNSSMAWWIPISYTTAIEKNFDYTEPKSWFNPEKNLHKLDVTLEEDEWIIFNLQLTGYFRVNYDRQNWNLLTKELRERGIQHIHILNRMQLLDDSFVLALGGKISYIIPFELSLYLKNETEYYPWDRAIEHFNDIRSWMKNTDLLGLFEEYLHSLVHNIYSIMANESYSDPINSFFKARILQFACSLRNPDCEEKALNMVPIIFSNEKNQPRELRDVENEILCSAIRKGGENTWAFVYNKYRLEKDLNRRSQLLHSLLCTNDHSNIRMLIEQNLEEAKRNKKEKDVFDFSLILEQQNELCIMVDYIEENYDNLKKMHGSNFTGTYLEETLSNSISEDCKKKVISFLNIHKDVTNQKAILKKISGIHYWIEHYSQDVRNWLLQQKVY